jgi:hypothetical protein
MEDDYSKVIRDTAARRQGMIEAAAADQEKQALATQAKFATQSSILSTKLLPKLKTLKSQLESSKDKPYIPLVIKESPSTATSGPSVSIVAFVVLDRQHKNHHTQSITFSVVEGNKIVARPGEMPEYADGANEFDEMKLPAEDVGQIVHKIAGIITDQHVTIMAELRQEGLLKRT